MSAGSKGFLRLFLAMVVLGMAPGAAAQEPAAPEVAADSPNCDTLQSLGWMLGEWKDQEDDTIFFEQWSRTDDGHLKGFAESFSEKSGERYMTESMVIKPVDGVLNYIVTMDANEGPVPFRMVSCQSGEARWENPDNDFPKVLHYTSTSEGMKASVLDFEDKGFDLNFLPSEGLAAEDG